MTRDSVSEDEVYTVVGDYDRAIVQDNGHTWYARMMEDGRELVAILDHDANAVMTVWWDKRASRRRRGWS